MRPKIALISLVVLGLWMTGCAGALRPPSKVEPTLTTVPVSGGLVKLSVRALPVGAVVTVDGDLRGTSPLDLSLAPGDHQMSLRADGYVPLTESLTLVAGKEAVYAPALEGVTPPAVSPTSDPAEVAWSPTAQPTPVIATAAPTQAPPTKPPPTGTPAATPSPEVTPTRLVPTTLRTTQVTILTYPYESFVRQVADPNLGDYPVMVLDRTAYDASNPQPVPQTYKLIVLENAYLRLDILPELGGRIYQVVFKPTGNEELYHNPVVKPTGWGPPSPPYPAGANWWLAAGGIEWCFPVEEHGYEWSTVWGYDHVSTGDGGIVLTLFTRDPRRPYAVVDIILPPDKAYFVIRPRITNVWGSDFRFQWWANAMLAPGAANEPGPDLRFIFPISEMTIHSTGDATLPGPGQPLSWPIFDGRDLSRLGNWTQWLGFFERPAAAGEFAGVYDMGADEGLIRVFPSKVARGTKVFAPGWSAPIDSMIWTDDGSGYVELQGGLTPTFSDWYVLPPGGEITWNEIWYPVAGIGGVSHATKGGAIHLTPSGDGLRVAVFPTAPVNGRVTVTLAGMDPIEREVKISPAAPYSEVIPYSGAVPAVGGVRLALTDAQGQTVLSYRGEVQLR